MMSIMWRVQKSWRDISLFGLKTRRFDQHQALVDFLYISPSSLSAQPLGACGIAFNGHSVIRMTPI
jgi:hypothetical protein